MPGYPGYFGVILDMLARDLRDRQRTSHAVRVCASAPLHVCVYRAVDKPT